MATPPSELPDPSSLPASWSTGSSPVGGTAEMAGDPAQAPPDDGVPNAAATAAAGGTEKKKTAWKNSCASNGVMNASSPVMGAVSWPALSEASSMASARSSAHSGVFLNGVSHGSSSAAPVIETNSNSSSSSVPAPLKDEQTKDHGVFSGSAKVENGSGPVAGGGPAAPAIYLPETGRARNSENGSRGGRGLPQAQGGNELRSSYSGNRRGGSINNGWGGPNRSNHQNWRGHGWRRGYDWNHRPSAPGGGALPVHPVHNLQHPQARGMGWHFPPRHISHSPQPFYHPPATVPPPFGCPVEYYGIPPPPPPFPPPPPPFPPPPPPLPPPSPSLYYGPPHAFVQDPSYTEPSPLFYAEPTLDLLDVLTRQIDYYFSEENLCKDKFLRKHMDDNGWVSLYLIARFNQVKYLTNNMLVILDAVSASTVVELEGLKVRRRNDWMRWPSLRHLATPIIGEDLINRLALNMDEDLP